MNILCFSSRRRHTRSLCDWSSDVCSSDLTANDEFWRGLIRKPKARSDIALLPDAQALAILADRQSNAIFGEQASQESRVGGRSEERRVGKEGRCRRVG